jgi:hypothetical protein
MSPCLNHSNSPQNYYIIKKTHSRLNLHHSRTWSLHRLKLCPSLSQTCVTTDDQPTSLSWCQAPIWGPWPGLYYCQTVAGLLMWDALRNEMTGLYFNISVGPCQCNCWETHDNILLSRIRDSHRHWVTFALPPVAHRAPWSSVQWIFPLVNSRYRPPDITVLNFSVVESWSRSRCLPLNIYIYIYI